MKNKDKKLLGIIILVGIFIIASTILFLIPFSYEATEFYSVKEPYTTTESYWDKEPYTSREPYQVQETYIDYEDIEYRVLEKDYYNYFWTSGCDVWINVQNIDNVGGYFNVNFDVTTSKGNYKTISERYFISSGSTQYFVVSFKGDYKSSTYDVNPPSKEVTKTKTVTKYRTITKTKTVTKYRTITKYKTLQKERQIYKKDTLFNMLTKKTQYVFYE